MSNESVPDDRSPSSDLLEDSTGPEPGSDGAEHVEDPAFERLLQFLKESRAFDFTGYKRPSLMRRVRYRMRELGAETFEEYQDALQLNPDEFTGLFNTILINVTGFFRDADAWEALRDDVVPKLLERSDGPIRVWSAGCSAGQEAYSIAMLLHELMGDSFRSRVKVYATDVDEEALNYARQASYTEREVRGLPGDLREKCFELAGGRYVLSPDLRRSVIFGRNDLTRDAPISRIDLLLCRNTLMYFNAETQSRIVSRLAFALRPHGVLFLGKAEMLFNHGSVFDPLDLKRRFFRRAAHSDVAEGAGFGPAGRAPVRALLSDNAAQLRNEIVQTNPIAQIAVGADGRLAVVNHRANGMLGLSNQDLGRPFQDLEISYRPLELRGHLAAVAESRTPLWLREVEWRRGGSDPAYLDVHVVPMTDHVGQLLGTSISFTDVTRFRQLREEVEAANRQLETAYEELQSTNEELETTNEELQSTVEELETTNEELQSTNEELEAMNDELQSANDELQIANADLGDRTLEISDLNQFMQSILGSLQAAVVVLDRELVVRVWTRQAYDLWGLRDDEVVGQHLLNLDSGLPTAELHPWLRSVIAGQQPAVVGKRLAAINRRGRNIDLRISVTGLWTDADSPTGALILMEEEISELEQ